MRRPQYGHDKRQREVAKQKKKEAKRLRKLGKDPASPEGLEEQSADDQTPAETSEDSPERGPAPDEDA